MIVAIDKDFNRIHIEDAVVKQECYCPYCGERLSQKRYTDRRSHFAHYPKSVCKDSWAGTYDMSDWHYGWQNSVPKDNQEILLALGEIKHRADVLIGRTVTEFQRSDMSAKAFSDRNNFYFNLGYKVIWVFDFQDQFNSGRLRCDADRKTFHWTKPRNTFNLYEILTGQVELFFQVTNEENDCLVKVANISPTGFEEFAVSGWYSKAQFLEYLGIRNGVCAPPDREDLSENEEYKQFCQQYGIVLNKQQERAVQAVEGANLLLAVPGSGKTTVLVARLGYMILCKNINPDHILAMTFSKQAAKDMRQRFCKVFGAQLGHRVEFHTIHSVANQIVVRYAQLTRKKAPSLLADNKKLIIDILKEHLKEHPSDSDIAEARAAITYIKNMTIPADDIPKQGFAIDKMEEVYAKYQEIFTTQRLMDYDDQVVFAVQLLKALPQLLAEYHRRYSYICIDEAQDTSKVQHELLRLLVGNQGNIFMVGDEDQSIYRFRGAFPQALIDFKDTYANPYILWMETNYRSTPEIVKIASGFIDKNQNRYPKNMIAHRPGGDKVQRIDVASRQKQYAAILEIAKKSPEDTAVIYRDNDSAIPLIDLLNKNRLPYRCPQKEFRFFTNKIVLDVVSFMKLQQNPRDIEAFRRICYKSDFYLDKKTVEYACNNVRWRGVTFLEALTDQAKDFDRIERAVRNFEDHVLATLNMGALEFLQYLEIHGYGTYMEKNHLDHNKFELLLALADGNPSVPDFLSRLDQLRELTADTMKDSKSGIILTTAHSSKGLEYDTVYLMDVYDGQFPGTNAIEEYGRKHNMDQIQEERRLFYVAMTRSKNRLYVFTIKGRPSSFADEILPPPNPPEQLPPEKPRYRIDQFRIEQVTREHAQAENRRSNTGIMQRRFDSRQRAHEEWRKAAEETQRHREELQRISEEGRKSAELARLCEQAAHVEHGFEEVKNRSFHTEDLVEDSFGNRWLECKYCHAIKRGDEFSSLGEYRKPSIGICSDCARKLK